MKDLGVTSMIMNSEYLLFSQLQYIWLDERELRPRYWKAVKEGQRPIEYKPGGGSKCEMQDTA